MKFLILVTFLVGTLLINDVTSQPLPLGGLAAPIIPPVIPPIIPPLFGLGLGLGFPFGPFGFPGLGLGLGLGRFGLLGGRRFFGKRDVNSESPADVIRCVLQSNLTHTFLNCSDAHHSVQCQAERRLTGLENLRLEIPEVELKSETVGTAQVFRLFTKESSSEYTFIHPISKEKVVLSLFSEPSLIEPGFLFKDPQCVTDLKILVKNLKDIFRFSLNVNP
jgi:hypothetical protein